MKCLSLRQKVIRLAHADQNLRPLLLPLLHEASAKSIHQKQFEDASQLSGVDKSLAKVIVWSGNSGTDKVKVSKYNGPASKLKPSQTTMVLPKSVGMALGMLRGDLDYNLQAIISKDNHIMDGHHRWSAAIIAGGSKVNVQGWIAGIPGKQLVRVLNLLTKGQFNRDHGNKGSGSLGDYSPENARKVLNTFVEKGMGGDFPWTPEDVTSTLEANFGSVEKGIETMSKNVSLISKQVPSWAPKRVDMPVINKNDMGKALNKLQKGEVDWHKPYLQG